MLFMTYRTTGVATYRNYDFFCFDQPSELCRRNIKGKMNALTMVIFMVLTTRVPMVTVSVSPQLMFMMALVSVQVYTKSGRNKCAGKSAANPQCAP